MHHVHREVVRAKDLSEPLYCQLWPVLLYHIFPNCVMKGTTFGGNKYWT